MSSDDWDVDEVEAAFEDYEREIAKLRTNLNSLRYRAAALGEAAGDALSWWETHGLDDDVTFGTTLDVLRAALAVARPEQGRDDGA